MAGSLNHIVDSNGAFTMDLIENMRDAREALEECHQIISYMLSERFPHNMTATRKLLQTLKALGFPRVKHCPILQPDLHGSESIFK